MNVLRNYFMVSIVTLTLVACASGPPSYEQNIQSAISGRGNVSVLHIEPGVVMLTGWVDNAYSKMAVYRAALDSDQIKQVINHIDVP